MKTIILTCLFYFLCIGFCYSQQIWAPAGATWYYTSISQKGHGYSKKIIDKDTIINGFPGKKIKVINYSGYPQLQADSLYQYYYNNAGVILGSGVPNIFDTVYNYNALPGDKWGYPYPVVCSDSAFILVTDTGTVMVNNQALKYKDVVFTGSYFGRNKDRLVERIGFLGNDPFYIDAYCHTDGIYVSLCSYHDSLIPAYPHPDTFCIIIPTGVLNMQDPDNLFSIYPNPATDFITINSEEQNVEQELSLYDLQGRVLFTRRLTGQPENKVGIYDLPAGIFLAEIKSRNGVKRQLFVKQ